MATRFKPLYGILLVLLVSAVVLLADYVLAGGLSANYERVSPAADGAVHIDVAALQPSQVRFFQFLNPGNQEVRFFVGRDAGGTLQVAFDANEQCYKMKRGYRPDGVWLTCNKCDKAFRLDEVNAGGGGCKPVPLAHARRGDELVITEAQVLEGWRYFR